MKLDSSLASRPARRAARRVALLATLLSGILMAGCGQKGALTLPQPAAATPATNAASAAAPK